MNKRKTKQKAKAVTQRTLYDKNFKVVITSALPPWPCVHSSKD